MTNLQTQISTDTWITATWSEYLQIIENLDNEKAIIKNIDFNGKDNCSYRKLGFQETQPDGYYYLGKNADAIPSETSTIDLEKYPPPDLVIEVANTSLSDDKGEKRMLYENLGVGEYWIVDVQNVQVIAFSVADRGSKQIQESLVLPGLKISLLDEALQRSRNMNQPLVAAWLMAQFKQ